MTNAARFPSIFHTLLSVMPHILSIRRLDWTLPLQGDSEWSERTKLSTGQGYFCIPSPVGSTYRTRSSDYRQTIPVREEINR